ncbi:MAG: hypothetical protein HYR94_06010, partial [Chloroflexi bacterium]|nr:hypothetical protein [Chloroflexota bacterium]
ITAGNAPLTLEDVLLVNNAGEPVAFSVQNSQLEVTASCTGIGGVVALQGRTDYGGISVTGSSGQQTQTQADGAFTISGADRLDFSFPGYLSAQADTLTLLAQSIDSPEGQIASLGMITLLAGDVNADNRIDILDMAYIAKFYHSGDSLADLNGDGAVNIFDLVLAASNYGQQGPLTNWR